MLMRAAAPSESSGYVPPAMITPSSLIHDVPVAHRPSHDVTPDTSSSGSRLRPHQSARPSCLVGHTTSGQSIIYHRSAVQGGPLCGHVREPPLDQHAYVLGSGRVRTPAR